jgi:hypothetical protein
MSNTKSKTMKIDSGVAAQSARQNAMSVGYAKWSAGGCKGSLTAAYDAEIAKLA